jgi:hypothetical protein
MTKDFEHFSAMFPKHSAETIQKMVEISRKTSELMNFVGPEEATLVMLDLAAQLMGHNGAPEDSFKEMQSFLEYMYKIYLDWENRDKVEYAEPVEAVPPEFLN